MKFHYKAQAQIGTIIEGEMNAHDKDAVIHALREKGATPIFVEPLAKKGIEISVPFIDNLFNGISLDDKVIFAKNLARMLQAGLAVSRALEVLAKQTTKKTLQRVIEDLIEEINTGGTLSSGLAKHPKVFSPIVIAMVHAGEESGNISDNLLEISQQLDKTNKLHKKIKGAMAYPAVIVSAMLIIGVLMFIFVIPTLLDTFRDFDIDLPATTQLIIFVSDALQQNTLAFLGVIVLLIAGGIALLRMPSLQKYIDRMILKIPVIGTIAKEMNAALATRTLSSLLGSGLSINRSLEITQEVLQNSAYKESLRDGFALIERGGQLSEIFQSRTDIYPIMVGEMIDVGEETGALVDMLKEIAVFYEEEVDNKTKNLSTIIEPVLMIIIGVAVGFFAISMMSPMYSLLDGIG